MSKRRTFVFFLATGLWPTFASAALDGHLPDFSAMHWAVFLAGSCVIAVAFILLEDKLRSRREETHSR
jgi:hypothetical protein